MTEHAWKTTTVVPPNRDELAMAAMIGWLGTYSTSIGPADVDCVDVAKFSYRMADAMLAERARRK